MYDSPRFSLLASVCVTMLFLGAAQTGAAQESASLHGYVHDASTGETLLQANVVLRDTDRGAATNNSGYYTLRGLEPGTYAVVFSYLGYQTRIEEVTLEAGEERRLDVELAPEGLEAEEVVVTGEEESLEEQSIGVDRLQTDLITELPSVLEPDLFRSLTLLPGITTASDYSSNLYIRGGGPAQNLILLDRTTVYNPSHFFGFFSTFNPDAIKDVQLYKGAYPAEYGGRLGSVIDIYNKDGNRRETTGGVSVGLLASRAYVEGPYGGDEDESAGSYMLAVRRSTLEPLLASVEGEGIPDQFAFYDINAKINYEAGPDDRLTIGAYGGRDGLTLAFEEGGQFESAYGNLTGSFSWRHLFSDQVFSTLTVTGSRYRSLPTAEVAETNFEQTNEVRDLSVRADVEYNPGRQHTMKGGLRMSHLAFELANTFDGEEVFRRRTLGEKAAVYVQETYTPTSKWEIQAGLRSSYFGRGDYLRLSPRVSIDYALTSSVQLQAAYGRYHQYLTLETSELFTGFDTWLMADEGVSPSYGDQVALGVKADLGASWRLSVEGYGRTMWDLFEQDPFLPDQAGVPYAERFHFGDGRAYGVEVQLRRSEGRINGFLSYTLGRTERRFPHINVDATGEPQYYVPKHDRTHDLTLVANYHLTEAWRLSSTFSYATGQAYTEPSQRYGLVDDPFLPQTRSRSVLVSPFNNARLPAYHRLDLGVARTGQFFGVGEYEVQLQAINAYARENVWFYVHQAEENGAYDREKIPQIPYLIPNLSFSLTF